MSITDKQISEFQEFLSQRQYRSRTVFTYINVISGLFDFYKNIQPEELTFDQVSNFIFYLSNRKKVAPSTIAQNIAAFKLFFNEHLHRAFNFESLKPKRNLPKTPEILSPDEVHRLLNLSIPNIKHKAILSVIYSAGLEISQALRLRIDDIDFNNREIRIRDSDGVIIRTAILAENLQPLLQHCRNYYNPEKWFFEGKKKGMMYSASTVQKALIKGLKQAKITKKVSVRNLKYSYVKHAELYGVTLPVILKNMRINNSNSVYFYSQMGLSDDDLSFSPYDRIIHEYGETEIETKSLEDSFLRINNKDEKSYLLEALKCLKARAPRAAVIMSWSAAIKNIHSRCLLFDNAFLNNALKKHYRNAQNVEVIADFENIKDRYVLEATDTLGLFDKREKNVLISCLDLRNQCGHPGNYMPSEMRVAAFLEDLNKIVFSRPYPVVESKTENIRLGRIIKQEDDGLPF